MEGLLKTCIPVVGKEIGLFLYVYICLSKEKNTILLIGWMMKTAFFFLRNGSSFENLIRTSVGD